MKEKRIYNFNAGPAALPLEVLEEIKDSFINFGGSGMSITEISHRSTLFDNVINDAVARTRRLLKLKDKFHVLFIQGGASLQFCMIPMNLLGNKDSADYVNTGTWSAKAIKEAEIMGKTIDVVALPKIKIFPAFQKIYRLTAMRSMHTLHPTIPSKEPNGRLIRRQAVFPLLPICRPTLCQDLLMSISSA